MAGGKETDAHNCFSLLNFCHNNRSSQKEKLLLSLSCLSFVLRIAFSLPLHLPPGYTRTHTEREKKFTQPYFIGNVLMA